MNGNVEEDIEPDEPVFPLVAVPVRRCVGWYQKIPRILMLTSTGCELLKTKDKMTAFFPYYNISQLKQMADNVIQILLDDNSVYLLEAQEPAKLTQELIKRISEWSKYKNTIQELNKNGKEVSDVTDEIPSMGKFNPPKSPYSLEMQQDSTADLDAAHMAFLATKNRERNTTRATNSIREINSHLDKFTKTTILNRVYSHARHILRDPSNKELQGMLIRFKQNVEKPFKRDDMKKIYIRTLGQIRKSIIENFKDDFSCILTEKYCKVADAFTEVEETCGTAVEDVLMSIQLTNKLYVFDVLKNIVATGVKTTADEINEAMNDLNNSGHLTYDTFEIKPKLRDKQNFIEISEELKKLNEEFQHDGAYFIDNNLPILTPTLLLTKQLEIINKTNKLISERTPVGMALIAVGDRFVVGAEDFNPIFEMCVARANIKNIYLISAFAHDFLDPVLNDREKGYYAISLLGLLESLKITCQRAHEISYKKALKELVCKNVSFDELDKTNNYLKNSNAKIDEKIKRARSCSLSFRKAVHKEAKSLEDFKQKNEFTDSFVDEQLEERLKGITFSKKELLEYFIKNIPISLRHDVLLGLDCMDQQEYSFEADNIVKRSRNTLVDVLRQLDGGSSQRIPLYVSKSGTDGMTYTVDKIEQKYTQIFPKMLAFAFIKYRKPSIYAALYLYNSLTPLYGMRSKIFVKLYDAAMGLLSDMNIALEKRNSGFRKGHSKTAIRDNPEQQDPTKSPTSDIFSESVVEADVKKFIGRANTWPEIVVEFRSYLKMKYEALAAYNAKLYYYLSPGYIQINSIFMRIVTQNEILQICIDRVSRTLFDVKDINKSLNSDVAQIIKSSLPDCIAASHNLAGFLLKIYMSANGNNSLTNNIIDIEKEMEEEEDKTTSATEPPKVTPFSEFARDSGYEDIKKYILFEVLSQIDKHNGSVLLFIITISELLSELSSIQ